MLRMLMPNRRKPGILGSILFAAISFVFLLIGLNMHSHNKNFIATGVQTEATVINIVSSRSSDSTTFKPEIQYQTATGETIQVIHATGANPPRYSVGDKVTIYYAPDNPYKYVIDSPSEGVVFLIFIGVGAVCLLASIGSIFSPLKRLIFRTYY